MKKLWFILFASTGCGGKDTTDSSSDTGEATDTEDTTDTIDTSEAVPTSSFTGSIEFADGTEISSSNIRVQMCQESCFIGILEGSTFTFPALAAGTYAFDAVPLVGDGERAYATPIDFIDINTEIESYALESTVSIFSFKTNESPVPTASVSADGDLIIDADADGFTPREGFEDHNFLASVKVTREESGLAFEKLPEEIVGIWQLGAFEAHISPAWSFSVQNSGLDAGTQLRVFNASYEAKEWLEVGTATVSDSGVIESDDGTGIQLLSTLVLTR